MGDKLGRKSREKRERRAPKALSDSQVERDHALGERSKNIRTLFEHYSADDVFVSLCVSDLWIPNISSQVKHWLAWAVALSISEEAFSGGSRVEGYADFTTFMGKLYELLPPFPSLEDYMPESDWGEIRYVSRDEPLQIFYGGAIERISDFITAFRLVHGGNFQALEDMHVSLLVQNHVLSGVDREVAGDASHIAIGHLEVPPEEFWQQCKQSVCSPGGNETVANISPGLVLELGGFSFPTRYSAFGDGAMRGEVLPGVVVQVADRYYPVSLRNAAATVIQYWANRNGSSIAASIAEFLAERLPRLLKGPLRLVTRDEVLQETYSAVILGQSSIYLVIALGDHDLKRLPQIERDVKRALSTGDWAIKPVGGASAIQIRGDDGVPSNMDKVSILAILSQISTVTTSLSLPRTAARFLPLADFVTIIESVDSVDEFDRYWGFVDSMSGYFMPFSGPTDLFGAFRDSNSLLVEGAVNPATIHLDPHWGSNWRHRDLEKYWDHAPPLFPDGISTSWKLEGVSDGVFTLKARGRTALVQSTVIDGCVVHFVMGAKASSLDVNEGNLLWIFMECLADSLYQRQALIDGLPIFYHRQIVTHVEVIPDSQHSVEDPSQSEELLLTRCSVRKGEAAGNVHVSIQVNLQCVKSGLTNASDSRFEAEACVTWLEAASKALGLAVDPSVIDSVLETATEKAHFRLEERSRNYDSPENPSPTIPEPSDYKRARRDLAIVFKDIEAVPGTYKLADAKALIDAARDKFRSSIHEQVSVLNRRDLVHFCVQQLDKLVSDYDGRKTRIEISLEHQVSYDRASALAEAHENFTNNSKNYRYLLECFLSQPTLGDEPVSKDVIRRLIASIDWLFVLYSASDTLHNGIDVAGLELDEFYVPRVFYEQISGGKETEFANEAAQYKLGLGLSESDEVQPVANDGEQWARLDEAFRQDAGASLSMLIEGLRVLSFWPSATDSPGLKSAYSVSRQSVCDSLVEWVDGVAQEEAEKIIDLLTLDSEGIRKLIGKSAVEGDVPVWEHKKRGDRFTIKPLIQLDGDKLIWSAALANQSALIWRQTHANGYMPADYDWPNVKKAVREIKASLEKLLETRAVNAVKRATPCVMDGIDFMRRFPEENFDDVGDFDVLAYWPEMNVWLAAECKYNQPAFCLKDARRLRDRIFGTFEKREQLAKIERRRVFLHENMEKIRDLLDWPSPPQDVPTQVHEVYVSREIYWWMRNPPYPVTTHFVRVDSLDSWLQSQGLAANRKNGRVAQESS